MNNSQYICPKCGNKDPRYFGIKNNEIYCRLCVSFQGKEAKEYIITEIDHKAKINYPLSETQQKISEQLISNFKLNKNSLIHAVCGSGKTELVYGVIEEALNLKMHVGFAVPRREVVVDLLPRFIESYPNHKVISIYGGNSNQLEGDIILLTTHQLYRFNHYFDLLILDEIDAFPFKDNTLLLNLFKKSIKGSYIMMSATPPDDIISLFKKNNDPILSLHTRYHKHPLPIPKIIKRIGYFKIPYLISKIKEYKSKKLPLIIFVPTISICLDLYKILHIFIKDGHFIHSKADNRNKIIKDFKNNKYSYLISTSVLERGVTIKNVQVIIYNADNDIYNKGVLIQISGRVGRKIDAFDGEVIYLINKITTPILESIKEIKYDNSFLNK